MIRYALICDRQHQFDVWFNNSGDCDKQIKRKLVGCPICDSTKVDKAIMAPAISKKGSRKAPSVPSEVAVSNEPTVPAATPPAQLAMVSPQEQEFRKKLKELRDHVIANADNVGKKFPDEARKMHYGEIEHRSIYGEASAEDAKSMSEEGIEFHPLPVLPEDRN